MKTRYYLILFIAAALLNLNACVDVDPVSSITVPNYWKSSDQIDAFNIGLHTRMRAHTYNFYLLGEARSDIFGDNPFGGEAPQGMERFPYNTLSEDNPGISNYGDFYLNINQLNLMIKEVAATTFLSEDKRNYYLGQAYGMRAYYYFHLLRSWGDAIIYTDPTYGENIDLPKLPKAKSSASEVLKLIKEDINASNDSFGNNYAFSPSKNYWSKAATQMLKAEVYLWSGRQGGGGVADYTIVKSTLSEIQSGAPSLGLMDNFKDVFSFTQKNNKEIIFSLKSQQDEFSLWNGSFAANFLPQNNMISPYYHEDGSKWNTTQENMFGLMRLQVREQIFKNAFVAGDLRHEASLKGVYNADKTYAGCFPYKYQGTNLPGQSSRAMLDDYPIYRYADLILMLAEAKSLLGENPDNEINAIRKRAFGDKYGQSVAYPNQAGDSDVNKAILKERLNEFMFEGKRWYDLRRFGNQYVFEVTYADNKDPRKLLWPIDKNTLTNNRELVQTPGFEPKQ